MNEGGEQGRWVRECWILISVLGHSNFKGKIKKPAAASKMSHSGKIDNNNNKVEWHA